MRQWEERGEVVGINMEFDSVKKGNKIYFFGGRTNDNTMCKNTVEIYDVITGTWTNGKEMPTKLYDHCAEIIGDNVYIVGGIISPSINYEIYIYNIPSDTWSIFERTENQNKYYANTASVDGKLYLFSNVQDGADIYDVGSDTWSKGSGGKISGGNHLRKSVVANKKIYFIGYANTEETLYIYDTVVDTWEYIDGPKDICVHHSVVLHKGKIYVIGGNPIISGSAITDRVYVYDYMNNIWSQDVNLPEPMLFMNTHSVGDEIYLFYGLANADYNKKIYVLTDGDSLEKDIHLLMRKGGRKSVLSLSEDLGINTSYAWSSDDNGIAVVDGAGNVMAMEIGRTKIYARSIDGSFAEYINVKVIEDDKKILAVDIKVGESEDVYLSDSPNVIWASLDTNTATVDSTGRVTGVKKGLTVVVAVEDGVEYYINVRVR